MYKYIVVLAFILGSQFSFAQDEEPKVDPAPPSPFGQLEEMFQAFGFLDEANGFSIDTMMIKGFDNMDMEGFESDQSMDEMMQLLQQQLSGLDFGDIQGFDKLFEGFGTEGFPSLEMPLDPVDPKQEPINKKKPVKKRNTYKL